MELPFEYSENNNRLFIPDFSLKTELAYSINFHPIIPQVSPADSPPGRFTTELAS